MSREFTPTMDTPGLRHEENSRGMFQCVASLLKAIADAGGHVDADRLGDMTITEFITAIAGQNNIRFIYTGPSND